jgi:hypothetical protein
MRGRITLLTVSAVALCAVAASSVACGGGGGDAGDATPEINTRMRQYIHDHRGGLPILDARTDFVCNNIEKVYLGTPTSVEGLNGLQSDVAKEYLDAFCQPYAQVTPGPSPTIRVPAQQ